MFDSPYQPAGLEGHAPSGPRGADGAAPSSEERIACDRAIQWMNRGHALSLRDAGREALVAYAHAITLLRPLPLAENPAWANSLGAALMNHGQLLHRVQGVARADEALPAFAEAIALLSAIPSIDVPWARRNLAGTHINRANLLLDLSCFAAAEADARSARSLVVASENVHLVDADLALKALRALCDALGQQIAHADAAQQDVLATEGGDSADAALALVRYWTARSENAFAPLAVRFFRFGAEIYRRHQPHFLVEFLEENLDAAPTYADELRSIAHLAIDGALADGASPVRHTFGDPASERALATRSDLAAARGRLDFAPTF